jgi:DNA topoisomerase-1
MPNYLVIVESPGKIKKLKQILGTDYDIIASMGHVVDLPSKEFGIDLNKMTGKYVTLKADVAKRLKASAQKPYKVIYLAADPDREGEAIAHHVANLLKRAKTKAKIERVTFDAITPSAVKRAFAKPRQIDKHLVQAQETRRLLDRLVGFPASRFLWQFVDGKGLSAGRVQSVALRLVVERDTEIRVFVPEEYWLIMGTFQAKQGDFSAKLSQWQGKKPVLKTQADAQAVLDALKGVDFILAKSNPSVVRRKHLRPLSPQACNKRRVHISKLPPKRR